MAQRELTQSSAGGILSGTRTGRADPERDHLATGKAAMREPLYPSLYQINTRVWLTERYRALGRPATLDDVPDDELDRAAGMGFDWIWLLSVWRTGPAAQRVRERTPGFCFMAEVYWDLEWTMLEQGFDYAYDKRPYDRLREGHARPGREHLLAGLDFQNKLARFLENHDEPRASATFAPGMHEAAAVITFLSPGLRFLHQGQFEGQWRLLECAAAWDGNWTSDCFIAWSWE